MRFRNLFICSAAIAASLCFASTGLAQTPDPVRGAKDDGTNPRTVRFGVWDNSTNPNNVMTYEKFEADGSKLTVSNPSDHSRDWSYVTKFDGQFRPVEGQPGNETAVEIISPKALRIINKSKGVVTQVVINTMSDDNNKIYNEYIRMDKDGKITGVTHVTYNRRMTK